MSPFNRLPFPPEVAAMTASRSARSLLALTLLLPLSSCLSDFTPVIVTDFKAVEAKAAGGGFACLPSDVGSTGGTLDSSLDTAYMTGIALANKLVPNDNTFGREDSHLVTIDTVSVDFAATDLTAPAHEDFRVNFVLDSGTSRAFVTTLLSSKNGSVLKDKAGSLVATVVLSGYTQDQDRFSTQATEFPITVCKGCLDNAGIPDCGKEVDGSPKPSFICNLAQPDGKACKQ